MSLQSRPCIVLHCQGYLNGAGKPRFFGLPKDDQLREHWLNVIGRKDMVVAKYDTVKNCKVCGQHFESIMFCDPRKRDTTSHLDRNAVPTMNLPGKRSARLSASTSSEERLLSSLGCRTEQHHEINQAIPQFSTHADFPNVYFAAEVEVSDAFVVHGTESTAGAINKDLQFVGENVETVDNGCLNLDQGFPTVDKPRDTTGMQEEDIFHIPEIDLYNPEVDLSDFLTDEMDLSEFLIPEKDPSDFLIPEADPPTVHIPEADPPAVHIPVVDPRNVKSSEVRAKSMRIPHYTSASRTSQKKAVVSTGIRKRHLMSHKRTVQEKKVRLSLKRMRQSTEKKLHHSPIVSLINSRDQSLVRVGVASHAACSKVGHFPKDERADCEQHTECSQQPSDRVLHEKEPPKAIRLLPLVTGHCTNPYASYYDTSEQEIDWGPLLADLCHRHNCREDETALPELSLCVPGESCISDVYSEVGPPNLTDWT